MSQAAYLAFWLQQISKNMSLLRREGIQPASIHFVKAICWG